MYVESKLIVTLGFLIVIIGFACNMVAVSYNGGYMPVKDFVAEREIKFSILPGHSLLTENTNYSYLCDIYILPLIDYGFIFSIGDVFVTIGFIILIIGLFRKDKWEEIKKIHDKKEERKQKRLQRKLERQLKKQKQSQ